jgi:hypothetical protein
VLASHPAFQRFYESKVDPIVMLAAVGFKHGLRAVPDQTKYIPHLLAKVREPFELWNLGVDIKKKQRNNVLGTMANGDARIERLENLARILNIAGSIKKHMVNNPRALLVVDVKLRLHLLDERHDNVGNISCILLPPPCKMVGTVGDVEQCKRIVDPSSKDITRATLLMVAPSPKTVMPKILASDRSNDIYSFQLCS